MVKGIYQDGTSLQDEDVENGEGEGDGDGRDSSDVLFSCGSNENGQLGRGTGDAVSARTLTRVDPPLPDGVKAAQVAGYHTWVLTTDGALFSCGSNDHGQLGRGGDAASAPTLARVDPPLPDGVKAAQVACGEYHTWVLTTDGALVRLQLVWPARSWHRRRGLRTHHTCRPAAARWCQGGAGGVRRVSHMGADDGWHALLVRQQRSRPARSWHRRRGLRTHARACRPAAARWCQGGAGGVRRESHMGADDGWRALLVRLERGWPARSSHRRHGLRTHARVSIRRCQMVSRRRRWRAAGITHGC